MTNNQLTDEELQTLIVELQQTAYRLNGTNSAYLMSDAIKPLRELQERRKAAMDSEPVAWLLSGGGAKNVVCFDSGNAYADPLREVTPLYRHAQQPVKNNEFIPQNLDKALGVVGVALPESKEEFNFQIERWIQRLIDRVIRYADEFKEPPTPLVPEILPCAVELKPGLILEKGCKTTTLLTALRSRADHDTEIDAMTPEERAKHDASIDAFSIMLNGGRS